MPKNSTTEAAMFCAPGRRCCSKVAVTLSANSRVAVMYSPAMTPMPAGDITTSAAVKGRPSVNPRATTARQAPGEFLHDIDLVGGDVHHPEAAVIALVPGVNVEKVADLSFLICPVRRLQPGVETVLVVNRDANAFVAGPW